MGKRREEILSMTAPDPNPNGGGEAGGCVAFFFVLFAIGFIAVAILKCHFGL